jgi:DedD protein
MDQALKARLIGAAVLVALAVLLIPELLSGRKPDGAEGGVPSATHGTRTFTIELAGGAPAATPAPAPAASALPDVAPAQAESAPSEATPQAGPSVPAGDSAVRSQVTAGPTAPGAASEAAPPSAAESQGLAATAKQAAPVPPPPAAASRPAGGGWAVQVGAFGSAATAEKMVDQLKSAGYRAYISPVSRSGKSLNRVRVGPEAERARAEGLAASLKARGLPATVVAND